MGAQTILWDGLAALGYEAYCKSVGWKSVRGEALPKWEALPPAIQQAWIAAAQAVLDAHSRAAFA